MAETTTETTTTTTENNTNNEGNTMTEKKYEIFNFKGTLTKCRFENGYMGKGDKAWRISLKLDKPLTAEIKDKILSILKIDKNDRFCPKWLKEHDSKYINVHSKFNIPCQSVFKDRLLDMDLETELFEGAEVILAIKVKEGGVYPHAIRVLKNGEPFNPFECFDN